MSAPTSSPESQARDGARGESRTIALAAAVGVAVGAVALALAGFYLGAMAPSLVAGGAAGFRGVPVPAALARPAGAGRGLGAAPAPARPGRGACLFSWSQGSERDDLWFADEWASLDLPVGRQTSPIAWFDRVHTDDLGGLVHALESGAAGARRR
ncbi:MAG: hypothetical protein U1F43_33670 [Myxococcota bacterium]